jgi:hypothetical protein
MTPEQKMAAREAGTVLVTVHPAPEPAKLDGLAAKQARHAVEGKTEEQREAEAKAKAAAAADVKPEVKPEAKAKGYDSKR